MKKTLLNIAVTMTLGSAIYSGSVLSTQAYAGALETDNNSSNDTTTESYLYTGMGVGAASGALIAGPVGLLVGGLVGAIAGSSQDVSAEPAIYHAEETTPAEPIEKATLTHSIQVAQLGTINNVVEASIEPQTDALLDILTTDLSLDIYFRSGSTNIESFYPARLAAIADLLNTMDQLELHLDGYSDRRGDKTKNIELAKQRIENVREKLINAGVDENRIRSKAFGEMKMVSSAGDLEAYTFDRKVVIRFQRMTSDSISVMTTALSESEPEAVTKPVDAIVADSSIEF